MTDRVCQVEIIVKNMYSDKVQKAMSPRKGQAILDILDLEAVSRLSYSLSLGMRELYLMLK